jgi:uncharacterized damage-inducible protein DinB
MERIEAQRPNPKTHERRTDMTLAQGILAEFETQAPITRRFLERLPEDRLTWKPHEKSFTAGQLAFHIAQVPANVVRLAQLNPAPAPNFAGTAPQPSSLQEILRSHDEGVSVVRLALPKFDDASINELWRIVLGDREVVAMPRGEFLRNIMLNHWYQHRGQFSVYLRILNIAVPASWGPSADELPAFLQQGKSA